MFLTCLRRPHLPTSPHIPPHLPTPSSLLINSHAANPNPDTTPSHLGLDFSRASLNNGPAVHTSPVIHYDDRNAEGTCIARGNV